MYGHRNGETTPPTERGWYWLRGAIEETPIHSGGFDTERQGEVVLFDGESIWFQGENCGYYPHYCKGEWYGPIISPWEQPAVASYPVEVIPPSHVLDMLLAEMEGDYCLSTLRYVIYNDAERDDWLKPAPSACACSAGGAE